MHDIYALKSVSYSTVHSRLEYWSIVWNFILLQSRSTHRIHSSSIYSARSTRELPLYMWSGHLDNGQVHVDKLRNTWAKTNLCRTGGLHVHGIYILNSLRQNQRFERAQLSGKNSSHIYKKNHCAGVGGRKSPLAGDLAINTMRAYRLLVRWHPEITPKGRSSDRISN